MAGVNIPFLNDQTGTNINGPVVGKDSKIRGAEAGEVMSQDQVSALLQTALDDRELGIHPDSDTLLEIVDGPAFGGGGSITFGTAPPSGGIDGDIYLQYSL